MGTWLTEAIPQLVTKSAHSSTALEAKEPSCESPAVSRGYLTLVTLQARISFGSYVLFMAVHRLCNLSASENELPIRTRLCFT